MHDLLTTTKAAHARRANGLADTRRVSPISSGNLSGGMLKDGLLTQPEAASLLHVSPRYLRDSACPKLLLPGTGSQGRAVVRYVRAEVLEWALSCRGRR